MEIQFSVPIEGAQSAKSRAPASSSAASSRQRAAPATAAAAGRGGTFQFALESRTRHTRRSSTRARTGCNTCKKRHVKCDETKPACLNCMKWRGYCDSYGIGGQDAASTSTSQTKQTNSSAKLIHTKKAPLILTEPDINSIRFTTAEERGYFDSWTTLSVSFLSGGLHKTRLWTTTMPQVTLEEATLRYAAMAVGALRIALENGTVEQLDTFTNRHYFNAVVFYCEALKLQSRVAISRESLRTALLASLLFICFETQRGNLTHALKHMIHGFSMLNELSAGSNVAPDLVRIAQSPPSMVQEILDCYKPLELQSRTFISYFTKTGFAVQKPVGQVSHSAQGSPEIAASRQQPASNSHPLQPESSRSSGPNQPQAPSGLPSPSTSGSPGSHSTSSQPPRHPSEHSAPSQTPSVSPQGSNTSGPGPSPPARPPMPPSIQPFSKESPYFRPKQISITSLEDMPPVFGSIGQAHGYWTLVQKQMVSTLPILTAVTASLDFPSLVNEKEVGMKLAGVKAHPRISKFVAEARYWLQRWTEAFEPYFQSCEVNRGTQLQKYLEAASIRNEYLVLYIYTTLPRFSGIIVAESLTPQYRELAHLSEVLITAKPHGGFTMDSGWTWPLFLVTFGCRDQEVREHAISLLAKYPIRNALRDSRVFRAIALRCQETERETAAEGNEHEQWLRLRRREIAFEHFGMHIIYRSAQKNHTTGQWEMVEEIADYSVNAHGTLNWKQQPITDAISTLSGAC